MHRDHPIPRVNQVNVHLLGLWRPEQKVAGTLWRPDRAERLLRLRSHARPTSEKTSTRIKIMNRGVAKCPRVESPPRPGGCSVHSRAHTPPSQGGEAAATKNVRHGPAE